MFFFYFRFLFKHWYILKLKRKSQNISGVSFYKKDYNQNFIPLILILLHDRRQKRLGGTYRRGGGGEGWEISPMFEQAIIFCLPSKRQEFYWVSDTDCHYSLISPMTTACVEVGFGCEFCPLMVG